MKSLAPNILLVGDSRERVRHLDECIARVGWHSTLANDSESAVAALQSMTFDVVIADLEFAAPSTADFVHLIQQTRPQQAILVVTDGVANVDSHAIQLDTILYPAEDIEAFKSRVLAVVTTGDATLPRVALRAPGMHRLLAEYTFTSAELVQCPFQLEMLADLRAAGVITRDTMLQVKLAFQEALTNSLEHGNLELKSEWKDIFDSTGLDKYSLTKKSRLADSTYAQRKIFLTVEYAQNELRFVIKDEGAGFSPPEKAPASADRLLCYGRGLAMISSAMDSVQYREEGRLIEMRRTLQQDA